MEFDPDRLAKLAGISGAEPASKPAVKQAPASSGLIRESAALRKHSSESKEVKQLRQLIRTEASQVIREMKAERRALAEGDLTRLQTRRSLNEAVAMGFYGPGFAGSRASTLGGPMTSSGRLSSRLFENDGAGIDVKSGDVENAIADITSHEREIEKVLRRAGITLPIEVVLAAAKAAPPNAVIKAAEEISGNQNMEEGWKTFTASAGTGLASLGSLLVMALADLDKTNPAHVGLAVAAALTAAIAAPVASASVPYGRGKPARDPNQ